MASDSPAGPDAAGQAFSIVCLSPQRWAVDLPTNRQQIMLRAARRGHEVLFVETGNFVGRHLWSLLRSSGRNSTAQQLLHSEPVAARLSVAKALNVVPRGRQHRLANRINCLATAIRLRRLVRQLPRPVVVWAYDPCFAQVARLLGDSLLVYDCVDDYAEHAGDQPSARALAAEADRWTAQNSQLVFTTATPLFERHSAVNDRTHLVRNVADYAHFAPAADPEFAAPELQALPRPIIGFAGNVMAGKVDLDLLDQLAEARPEWSFALLGPVRPNAAKGMERLAARPNVHYLGPRAYADVPRAVAGFDVGLIPYVSNTYTRSCFPLKTFEYLAAGKPVVATGLPELANLGPDVRVTDGATDTIAAIEAALERRSEDDRARRMTLAAANTWDGRTERLLGLIAAELG